MNKLLQSELPGEVMNVIQIQTEILVSSKYLHIIIVRLFTYSFRINSEVGGLEQSFKHMNIYIYISSTNHIIIITEICFRDFLHISKAK